MEGEDSFKIKLIRESHLPTSRPNATLDAGNVCLAKGLTMPTPAGGSTIPEATRRRWWQPEAEAALGLPAVGGPALSNEGLKMLAIDGEE